MSLRDRVRSKLAQPNTLKLYDEVIWRLVQSCLVSLGQCQDYNKKRLFLCDKSV